MCVLWDKYNVKCEMYHRVTCARDADASSTSASHTPLVYLRAAPLDREAPIEASIDFCLLSLRSWTLNAAPFNYFLLCWLYFVLLDSWG